MDRFETELEQRAYTIGHSEGYQKGLDAAIAAGEALFETQTDRDLKEAIQKAKERVRPTDSPTVFHGDGDNIHIFPGAMPNGLFLTPEAMLHVSVTLKDGDALVHTKEQTGY